LRKLNMSQIPVIEQKIEPGALQAPPRATAARS
jgi:hypothetical protein